jgi:predicted CXXCH cytochrome family protein
MSRTAGICLAVALLAGSLAVVLAAGWLSRGKKDPPSSADPFPLPAVSASPYLNTTAEARYVGSQACRECHGDRWTSFRRTGMGQSMAEVNLLREPPDGAYDHVPSKRRYQVRRKDGQMWHRELLAGTKGEEVVLAEYPVKYVVGSGRHSLTYLVEVDGFLVESPITWYSSRKAWAMSPGYDRPNHSSFERAVGDNCLICHAGQADAVGGSLHRMHVGEAAIGCERCHGPGSLHVARHAGRKPATPREAGSEIDYTIVNPSHLSRDLAEAICQQCHLQAGAIVAHRGWKLSDFRPGLPLQDFRADYRLAGPDSSMTVVGHVEQMHLSRCYQATKTLTCLTCHDPHNEPEPADRVAHYRAVCVNCHRPQRCTVPVARRQRESPDNNCVFCHMPTSSTEIPHIAFTHHRIGLHKRAAQKGHAGDHGPGVLEPFLDLARLSAIDRQRSLGLGYIQVASQASDDTARMQYQERALKLLSEVHSQGLRDPALDTSLGRLRAALGLEDALSCAESALTHSDISGQDRCDALFIIADAQARQGRYLEAMATLKQLNGLRRHALQFLLLEKCERALGNTTAAEKALEKTVSISPRLWQIHEHLAEYHRRQGDAKRAAWHQRRAVP